MYYFMPDNVQMKCRMSENPLLVWFEFSGPLCKAIGPILSDSSDNITTGRYSYGQLKTVLQMAYVLQYHPPRFNLTIQSLLWRFIAETSGSIPYKPQICSPEIIHTLKYIKTMPLNHKISVEDLAKESSLPIETFRKRFQSEIGEPPLQYLLHYKIAKAKEMIGNKELTIKQIAIETGFTDPYYFSRLFKQYENVSPSSFRKKIYHDDMYD
jgi:AraC-like DNA-binding protein